MPKTMRQNSLIIACVKWGNCFGACYVNILYDMVQRHMPLAQPFTFICFTDNAEGLYPAIIAHELPEGLTGWWNKLYLFKEGIFTVGQRVIYFDLDTLITGNLEPILYYQGPFALLRDFYRPNGYGSGVMLWEGGTCHSIWSDYEAAGRPILAGGDQEWIEKAYANAEIVQNLFPQMFASYKVDCHPLPPENTRVLCFHGEPKQDNCNAQWVRDIWKIGGIKNIHSNGVYQTTEQERLNHIRHAITLPYPWLENTPAHERHAVLIGGGPSLNESVEAIRHHKQQGHTLFSINNSSTWLKERNINFDAHVMLHARAEHIAFIPTDENILHYYASTCHPASFVKAGGQIIVWHPVMLGIAALVKTDSRPKLLLEGSTAGLSAIRLAYALGYRHLHLYGFDSCVGGNHHAYAQPEHDKDRIFEVAFGEQNFNAAAWMIAQAKEFIGLADEMIKNDCMISIYGDGLLPLMAKQMAELLSAQT